MLLTFLPYLLFLFGLAMASPPQFIEESIELTFTRQTLQVAGVYTIINPSSGAISILYPFPEGALAERFVAMDLIHGQALAITPHSSGFRFKTPGGSRDTTLLLLGYTEQLKGDSAEYILTTTRFWGKPLQNSRILAKFPYDLTIKSWSYQPDSCRIVSKEQRCWWNWKNFWPDRNWKVLFKPSPRS